MNINKAFPGDWLKAADLDNKRLAVTIESVSIEKIGEDTRPVVRFVGKEKGLVLNKTNANMIIEITGTEETDNWEGERIVLYVAKVEYQGKRVPAIRVDYVPGNKPKPPEEEPVDDSDIPFKEGLIIMARQKGITYYSETWPGTKQNYDWPVQYDITDGIVGITQTHTAPLSKDEPPLERILLSNRQMTELIKFVLGAKKAS